MEMCGVSVFGRIKLHLSNYSSHVRWSGNVI